MKKKSSFNLSSSKVHKYYFNYYFIILPRRPILDPKFPLIPIQGINHHIIVTFLIYVFIVITQHLCDPFLLVGQGKMLFKEIIETMMVFLTMLILDDYIGVPCLKCMKDNHHSMFHRWIFPSFWHKDAY